MTHSTEAQDEFLVTACPDHGVKVCSDYASFVAYVAVARDDDYGWVWQGQTVTRTPAAQAHDASTGADPWRCCWHMVIDPYGMLDH